MCNAAAGYLNRYYGSIELTNNCSDETTPNIVMDSDDINGVTRLDLNSKIISDITGIEHFINLTDLDLYSNQITDLTPLSNLTNLTYLRLNDNQISDLTPLSNLTRLDRLMLYDNQISDLNPLSTLTRLEHLYLGENQISDLTPLSRSTRLSVLILGNNPLFDITPILLIDLSEEPFLDGEPPIFDLSDITNNREYTLPSLFQFFNATLDVTPVADWVTNSQEMFREWKDEGIFRLELQNAIMNEDGKSITILDTNEPAAIDLYLVEEEEEFSMALLTVTYEEPIDPDDPTDPTDEPAVPDTGKNTKESSTATITATLCILSGIILTAIPMTRIYRKNRKL